MSQVLQMPAAEVPVEVLALATEQGVSDYLMAILQMTRRTFPESPLTVSVDSDPEIANDRHILVGVNAHGTEVDEALTILDEWHDGLFECCPASLVSTFRLALSLSA
jgi:hypothetical protein